MNFVNSLIAVSAEELLSGASLVLLLVAAWGGDKAGRAISIAAFAVLVGAAAIAVPALVGSLGGTASMAFDGHIRLDAFASFAKLLIYLGAGFTLIIAPGFFDREGGLRAEFPLLVLLAALGMGIMVSANNMLTLYLGLELNSLAAYVLAAILRSNGRSAEAGLKYFVLGSLASGILLYGISLTYGFTGTTSFDGIRAALGAGPMSIGATFGLVFVLSGLAFKVSAAPFHMWTPDVYEGAPTPVTAFFATAPKVAALALLMRVSLGAFGAQPGAWQQIVIFASLLSIVIGALGAIGQDSIKRLLAYSSINNVGYMLIGLAAGTAAGASAMLVYLVIYVVTTVAAFVVVLALRDADGNAIESIPDLGGLSRTRPGLAFAMASVMFGLAGIPPLFGFYGKFVVFQAAVQAHLMVLAVLGYVASVIGAFYYLKVVKVLYFDDATDKVHGQNPFANGALLIASSLFLSPLGYVLTPWLSGLASNAAAALFRLT
ncbi:NADH-quinone oxidoreductase subunit NuoN [Novosphingobium sp.]|uniref:NADH-quinone oxidoreductase subunit NuoN n=1 Tax=Novosphingobium sp. TaxID=1874826 RepID=UPI003B52C741